MLNVAIIGATGYAGEELIDILLGHPQVRIKNISAKISGPLAIEALYPRFKNRISLICAEPDVKKIASECDLIFLALPHTVSMDFAPAFIKAGKRVVDLSADYRFKDAAVYEKHYGIKHKNRPLLAKVVYGLPEIYRNKISKAAFIANPGCYPTAAILALAPLAAFGLAEPGSIIIDAKSGVTGAGRKLAESFLFPQINEDFKAYKVDGHQHAPEIDQELSKLSAKKMKVVFVPHLLPLNRGILATIYVNKAPGVPAAKYKAKNLVSLYRKFYQDEPFVRIKDEGSFPALKDVVKTNFCDIGIKESERSIIIISAIDNLLKGASGQAVQNMNIMCGFPQETALL